jgi:hypothetical protein
MFSHNFSKNMGAILHNWIQIRIQRLTLILSASRTGTLYTFKILFQLKPSSDVAKHE